MKEPGKKPTASMEDYLEAVLMLEEQGEKVSVTMLSDMLGVKKPSVDWALKKLSGSGLILHERYGDIELTAEGSRLAAEVYRRHKVLRKFLTEVLKVDPDIAEDDACSMEHNLSRESINRLEKFISFVLDYHPGLENWEEIFDRYVNYGGEDTVLHEMFKH